MIKPTALLLTVALSSCFLTAETKDAPQGSAGDVLWAPDVHEGWKIAAVTRKPDGRLELFANPSLVYQDAMDCGRSINNAFNVCTRYVEIIPALAANGSAQAKGWRDPMRRFQYPILAKSFNAEAAYLDIYTNGTNYLCVLTTINKATTYVNFKEARSDEKPTDAH